MQAICAQRGFQVRDLVTAGQFHPDPIGFAWRVDGGLYLDRNAGHFLRTAQLTAGDYVLSALCRGFAHAQIITNLPYAWPLQIWGQRTIFSNISENCSLTPIVVWRARKHLLRRAQTQPN